MEPSRDAFEKEDPSARSAQELLDLLLRLNAKLQEKIRPEKKRNLPAGPTDTVIIIMTQQERQSRNRRAAPMDLPDPPVEDWMEKMFAQIEKPPVRRRKKS